MQQQQLTSSELDEMQETGRVRRPSDEVPALIFLIFDIILTEGKNQALVEALPFCGEYPGPRSEDKFRSSNQMDGISIADP